MRPDSMRLRVTSGTAALFIAVLTVVARSAFIEAFDVGAPAALLFGFVVGVVLSAPVIVYAYRTAPPAERAQLSAVAPVWIVQSVLMGVGAGVLAVLLTLGLTWIVALSGWLLIPKIIAAVLYVGTQVALGVYAIRSVRDRRQDA